LALIALLAYANGANDNSKGVATLVGYGAASPRQGLLYATVTTAIGAGLSFWFSGGMLKHFSAGLFTGGTPLSDGFFLAVLIGAFGWVIFATYTGLPVSTTHAITGALIGACLVAFGQGALLWETLGKTFVLPLLLGPVLSLAAVYLLARPVVWVVNGYARRCVCAVASTLAIVGSEGATSAVGGSPAILVGDESTCAAAGASAGLSTASVVSGVHWLSGGMVGFARGWNDAPKIAALGLVALPGHMGAAFAIVTAAMAIGGLLSGRRVLQTLANKLTPMPLPQSLTASMMTASLVCLASWHGLPVSTTHVSTGAIVGAGLHHDPRGVRWKKFGEIGLSWVITLPAAAILAGGTKWVLG
jgi:PiT family inorganic phosphate transporter